MDQRVAWINFLSFLFILIVPLYAESPLYSHKGKPYPEKLHTYSEKLHWDCQLRSNYSRFDRKDVRCRLKGLPESQTKQKKPPSLQAENFLYLELSRNNEAPIIVHIQKQYLSIKF